LGGKIAKSRVNMSENWIVKAGTINDLASYVITSAKFQHDNKNSYRADIPLFKSQTPNEQQDNDLQCVLNILINTTLKIHFKNELSKEACLSSILQFDISDGKVTIKIDSKHKDVFKSVYPDLLNAIKQYNPSFKDHNTSLQKLKLFDMSPFIKDYTDVANEAIEKTNTVPTGNSR
jgi:hypothetical protein